MIDVGRNEIKDGTLQEIRYADDIVLIAETNAERWNCIKNYTWKRALESKGLNVSLMKTKVMVSKIGQITVKQRLW